MGGDRFFEYVELGMDQIHADPKFDVDAFMAQHSDAHPDVAEFLRDMLTLRMELEDDSERLVRNLLVQVPAIMSEMRRVTVGDLFSRVSDAKAMQHRLTPPMLRRLQAEKTPLVELLTDESKIQKARELRVDAAHFLNLFDQLVNPEGAVGELIAAMHMDDPTKNKGE